jgi:hypothetical protein
MRKKSREVKEKCLRKGKKVKDGSKKWLVVIATDPKVLQSALTGVSVGIILAFGEGTAALISRIINDTAGLFIPTKYIYGLMLIALLPYVYWAESNRERWREKVENVTNEDSEQAEEDMNNG